MNIPDTYLDNRFDQWETYSGPCQCGHIDRRHHRWNEWRDRYLGGDSVQRIALDSNVSGKYVQSVLDYRPYSACY